MKLEVSIKSVVVDVPQLDEIIDTLSLMMNRLRIINRKETLIMGKLEDALVKVDTISTKMDVMNTALDGTRAAFDQLKADFAALVSGEVLSEVVAAKVQVIIDSADTAIAKVDETYAENFPAEPPPPPEV